MKKLIFKVFLLILSGLPIGLFAQDIMVNGTVTDAVTKEPLPGTAVVVKGTQNGVTTDVDGRFTLKVEAKDVPEESQRLVLNHAKAAYLYFLNFPEIDVEALEILRQHHGSKHGVGFPVSPDLGLHPLSYIFMICEELAYQLIQTGDLKNLPKILDQMYDRMRTPDNAKYLKAMKEISQISLLN